MLRNWQEKARPANRVAQFLRIVAVVSPWHYTQNRWITWRVVGQPETGPGRLFQGCPSFAPGSAEPLTGHLKSHRTNLLPEERIKFYELSTTRTNGGNYSYLSATIGSTRMAHTAGRVH